MNSDPGLPLPLAMLIVFSAAKLLAELSERLKMPGLIGEILAGVLIGPSVLGWITPNDMLRSLADLGVMFLLFRVGLEVKSSELLKVGGIATVVAASGVVVPLLAGWAALRYWGYSQVESIFVGAALTATSVGITAQVLSAKGLLSMKASQIILAAAVIDDVLGLIVLAAVSSSTKGSFRPLDLLLTATLPIVFTVVIAKWGTHTVKRVAPRVESKLRAGEVQFNLSIILLLALSVLAIYSGIAAIVGAFLAGMSLGEHVERRVHTLVHGTAELFVPFFLAGIGLHINLAGFRDPSIAVLSIVILVLAVLTKLVGCGLGAWPLGLKDMLRIGVGMAPRGEVGMVVAQLGLSMGALSQPIYGVVVFAALATTLVAPPLLNLTYKDVVMPAKEEHAIPA
jgi:Kef-type K+ transport system membrane component KefB